MRRAVLEDWLLRGGSVCPFARGAALIFADDRDFAGAATAFSRTWSDRARVHALVIVASEDPPSHEAGRAWAEGTFLRLAAVCLRLAGRPKWEVNESVALLREILDPADRRYPFLAVRGGPDVLPAYANGLGPQYPSGDPRHAPVTCLVTTWMHEVKAAPRSVVARIHDEMRVRTGVVYGADVIWRDLDVS